MHVPSICWLYYIHAPHPDAVLLQVQLQLHQLAGINLPQLKRLVSASSSAKPPHRPYRDVKGAAAAAGPVEEHLGDGATGQEAAGLAYVAEAC
jgi:hypothetical protein